MPQAEEPSESRMRENLMSGSMRGGWKRGRRALGTRRWEAAPRKAPDLGPATAPVAYSTHKGEGPKSTALPRRAGGCEVHDRMAALVPAAGPAADGTQVSTPGSDRPL